MGEGQDSFQHAHDGKSVQEYQPVSHGSLLEDSFGFDPYEYWPLRLTFILFGYATIVIPTYVLIIWVKKKYSGKFWILELF